MAWGEDMECQTKDSELGTGKSEFSSPFRKFQHSTHAIPQNGRKQFIQPEAQETLVFRGHLAQVPKKCKQ